MPSSAAQAWLDKAAEDMQVVSLIASAGGPGLWRPIISSKPPKSTSRQRWWTSSGTFLNRHTSLISRQTRLRCHPEVGGRGLWDQCLKPSEGLCRKSRTRQSIQSSETPISNLARKSQFNRSSSLFFFANFPKISFKIAVLTAVFSFN